MRPIDDPGFIRLARDRAHRLRARYMGRVFGALLRRGFAALRSDAAKVAAGLRTFRRDLLLLDHPVRR